MRFQKTIKRIIRGDKLMNQFKVECSEVNYFTVLVEANSIEEARQLARADINSFPVEVEFTGEWDIESIEEL